MVKVLDFGIAKAERGAHGLRAPTLTLTGAGVVIGTPQYMSPEQAMGKRGDELDGRADLYSLGVVMYQMLTADLPFKADTTMEMLLAHMQKPPAPIEVLHPELQVPEDVAALTLRLLEKNRDMRPASARALIQEIEKLEKDMLSPGTTKVVPTDDLIRARERQNLEAGRRVGVGPAPQPPGPQPQPHRPVEPPRPAPAVVIPQPPVTPPPVHPKHRESRWGMWVAMIVLFVGIGGGGLYIATRPASPQPEPGPSPSPPNPNPTPVTPTTPTPTPPPEVKPETNIFGQHIPGPKPHKPRTSRGFEIPRTEVPEPPPVDQRAVKGKITLGDFDLGRGEYHDAIIQYQEGLKLDPSNSVLHQKLDGAIKACNAEKQILKPELNCSTN